MQPDNTTPQTQPIAPIPQHQVQTVTQPALNGVKPPWSNTSMYIASLLFGVGGGFMIVWQGLKKIGKEDVAKKFFLWGGLATLILVFAIARLHISSGYFVSLVYIILFERFYLMPWKKENPDIKPKFSWSIVGWGLLGMLLSVILYIIISVVIKLVFGI